MKKLAATICIIGTALTLAACSSSQTSDSGASYATERTAGKTDGTQRVFRSSQSK